MDELCPTAESFVVCCCRHKGLTLPSDTQNLEYACGSCLGHKVLKQFQEGEIQLYFYWLRLSHAELLLLLAPPLAH